ncbi:MAG: tRNA 4-thiouridine(8) synthase ThiI [Deltaproteobacteria bacterium]|nr:MAG: tRNA 4-thiouridine(8) synthase ThiI [Deltaproteobacteria bacterium]
MKVRAIGLMSGGLDSMLAVKVLMDQGVAMTGITFRTPFFGPGNAQKAARQLGIPLRVEDIGGVHLEMLKNPVYGYGSQMNPCIDCHALMLGTAGQIMDAEKFDFLCTGEVLGQRPMSQRRDALMAVDKLSGYRGYILRPLSAKLLPKTIPEQRGKVDREQLMDIHGRSRKRQMALAAHYGIEDYPSPGGGCILTKVGFAERLRDLLATEADVKLKDVELLKWGRHLRLPGGRRLVVGRVHADNVKLQDLAQEEDLLIKVKDIPGPVGFLRAEASAEEVELAAEVVAAYSDATDDTDTVVVCSGKVDREITVTTRPKEEFRSLLIQ